MAGVTLTPSFDDARMAAALGTLAGFGRSPGGVLGAIGVKLASNTWMRFREGIDPSGRRWADYAPLNPLYASHKYGPSILVGAGMRGGLQGSITSAVEGNAVLVGSNKIYAAVHQFGAVIRPKVASRLRFTMGGRAITARSVTIPARPYLGLSDTDRADVFETLDGFLRRAMARA